MCGAIPLFPRTPSWHLIKLGDHRAFKMPFPVPYYCRQKYSKQILSPDQDIFLWDAIFAVVNRRIMVFCGMTSCSLVVMHSFGWTYSLLLQDARHGGSIFFRIVGVYKITRRHTPKYMILASPDFKRSFLHFTGKSKFFFGHFEDYSLYHVQICSEIHLIWHSTLTPNIFSYRKYLAMCNKQWVSERAVSFATPCT